MFVVPLKLQTFSKLSGTDCCFFDIVTLFHISITVFFQNKVISNKMYEKLIRWEIFRRENISIIREKRFFY